MRELALYKNCIVIIITIDFPPFPGGHALHVAGKADSFEKGQKMAAHAIKTGSAKKKFMDMLHAQGVSKQNVKDLFKHRKIESGLSPVLPVAHYFTHLSAEHTGQYLLIAVTLRYGSANPNTYTVEFYYFYWEKVTRMAV